MSAPNLVALIVQEMPFSTFNLRRNLFYAACIALAALVMSGCDKQKVAHSKSLERNALMSIVFPGWKKTGPARIQEVELPESGASENSPQRSITKADIEPIYVVRLDEKHAVMLTHTLPVTDDNQLMDCHACSNYVGAYFFALDDAGWRLTKQQDDAVRTGLEGNLGDTKIVQFGSLGYVFASEWGSCWQGYCGSWLVLAGLQPDRATVLAKGIPMAAQNAGAYADCTERLTNKDASSILPKEQVSMQECFDVSGAWKPDGATLKVIFQSTISSVDDNGRILPRKEARESAIYEVKNGTFTLEKGRNPVPAL